MSVIASWSNSARGADQVGSPSDWRHWRTAWSNLRHRWQARAWQRRAQRQEAYLSEAVDLYDLDRRMRDLDRDERPARFIGYF